MSEVIETRGRYRAVLHLDEMPSKPDGDYFGYVFLLSRWGLEHWGKAYSTPDEDFGIKAAWEHFRDMELVERYLRMFWDVVGFAYFDTEDSKVINVVTVADLNIWGWDTEDRTKWPAKDPAENNLDEWRAYVDGDVYFYTIEERNDWHRTTETVGNSLSDRYNVDEDMSTWDEVDSLHGYYGDQYAREAALEALDGYAPKDTKEGTSDDTDRPRAGEV